MALSDITGVRQSAYERLALQADFSCSMNGIFNPVPAQSHSVFRDVEVGTTRTVTIAISGQSLSCESIFSEYVLTRATDGSLNWSAQCALQNGAVPLWT